MRPVPALITVIIAMSAAAPLAAEIPLGPNIGISADASVATDYRFRGVSFSDEDFAVQGGVELGVGDFYVGAQGSSIEFDGIADVADAEVKLFGGWSREIGFGLRFDGGFLYNIYPGGEGPFGIDDYAEPYASLGYSIGPAEATVGAAYAWSQDAIGGEDSLYVYGDVAVGVPLTPLTLVGHVGYTDGALAFDAEGERLDWSLGGEYVLGPVALGVSYVDSDISAGRLGDATVVGSVGVRF